MSRLFSPQRPHGATKARGATPSGLDVDVAALDASLKSVGSYDDVVVGVAEVACLDNAGSEESKVVESGGGIFGVEGTVTGIHELVY
ncbi:hypothetical protein PMKS-002813 [Pichia membranifaciens]|uniref:Uncharacterized protein n=1 Tax=Pichia membranifaciens TaxID=4926 RepID=A0A1Q2YIM7_9ASCO|nr:hypothetical protein PMKS-002813 [Pichia membranifaciens]